LITHKDDNEIEKPSFELLGAIETMLNSYMVPKSDRERFKTLLEKVATQEGAREIMAEIAKYRPIMGVEAIPQDMREINEAVRNRLDIEDFKERDR